MLVIVLLLGSAQGALPFVEVSRLLGLLGLGVGVSAVLLLCHCQSHGGQTVVTRRWGAARELRTPHTRPSSFLWRGDGEGEGAALPPEEQVSR